MHQCMGMPVCIEFFNRLVAIRMLAMPYARPAKAMDFFNIDDDACMITIYRAEYPVELMTTVYTEKKSRWRRQAIYTSSFKKHGLYSVS